MADISELESRIKGALERIGAGVDQLGQSADTTADKSALEEALDAEKMANAQLEERLRTVRESHEAQLREAQAGLNDRIAALEGQLEELKAEASDARTQVRALRQSNQRLQASLTSLREAGLGEVEPHLINHAMMSEIEALRATRAAEQAELDEILGALKPMLKTNGEAVVEEGGANA